MERRLAAIMATDVVGYSRLIRADEEGTIAALQALRADLIDPKIAEHHGRIVKLMGDGMLAEFASVVDAVRAAAEAQQAVAERNAQLPEDKRIEFRVGINLGDVVIDGDDIHGDGVNVAARLEGLAEPGGICISGAVHDQVRDRLDLVFEDLGDQEVKNIERPVRVWRWVENDKAPLVRPLGASQPLPLPDKPSIAVLPFDNMSGDPEQEYFADGITEDIITALSRVGWVFVIARNSTFVFKGRSVDVGEVGQKLGVRYVLEGSVRKAGNRVRVTAQLIDTADGSHLWAERYDENLEDIFELQDRITENVVGTIEPKLRLAEIQRVRRKPPENLDAYDCVLRALPHLSNLTAEDNREARIYLARAIEIDPRYAPALGYAAWCRAFSFFFNWSEDPTTDMDEGLKLASAAIEVDANDPIVLRAAALATAILRHEHERALTLIDKSLRVDSNSALSWAIRGWINAWTERLDEGLIDFQRALRLSPFDSWSFLTTMGIAYTLMATGRSEEGLPWARQTYEDNPVWPASLRNLASCLVHCGHIDEAKKVGLELMKMEPNLTVADFLESSPFNGGTGWDRYAHGMIKAGVPEE